MKERILEIHHSDTGNSLNILAALLWNNGDCDAAQPMLARLLATSEKSK